MSKALDEYYKLMEERPELFDQSPSLSIVTDVDVIRRFEKENNREIGVVYKSRFNMMVVDLVQDSSGKCFCYERVIPTSTGKAVVVLTLCNGKYVLLNQFRHAIRRNQLAFVRGFGEDGISASDNVIKELTEEIRANVLSMDYLGEVVSDSGLTGNWVSVYACEIDSYEFLPGEEGIQNLVFFSEDEMREAVGTGKITDGFSLSAYALYQEKRAQEE